jgi:glyoxalase family protein
MNAFPRGLHHVTAIASDLQKNIDFYAGLLGLRLVKRTVNFDDPTAYHLYYGDAQGTPGSIVTFFYWPHAGHRGRVGAGQVRRLSFSASPAALDFWMERLTRHHVSAERVQRFDEDVISLTDPDGIAIEIVAAANDPRRGWTGAGIAEEHALRGLHTAELLVHERSVTERLLEGEMGFRLVKRTSSRARFESGEGGPGTYVDVVGDPQTVGGLGGVGTIHHLAFRVPDDPSQRTMQVRLNAVGYLVSAVRDRSYFRSIYYRERCGVLFEIATDIPGFAIDEPVDSLGTTLRLPRPFEEMRSEIERTLPPLSPPKAFN